MEYFFILVKMFRYLDIFVSVKQDNAEICDINSSVFQTIALCVRLTMGRRSMILFLNKNHCFFMYIGTQLRLHTENTDKHFMKWTNLNI